MELGSKICKLRKSANISQEQLAEKLNVTRQTISNWELGQTTPDIIQAKQIAKIFSIGLDELTDNDIKDILIEKISNTEKMATTTMKILKFLCITIICFLIVVISINIMSCINNSRKQTQEQEYQQYKTSTQTKQFYFTVDDEKYSYMIRYDEDYKPTGDAFALISAYNIGTDLKYETHSKYILESFDEYNDARERIKDLKQYFENNGGTWEEI